MSQPLVPSHCRKDSKYITVSTFSRSSSCYWYVCVRVGEEQLREEYRRLVERKMFTSGAFGCIVYLVVAVFVLLVAVVFFFLFVCVVGDRSPANTK